MQAARPRWLDRRSSIGPSRPEAASADVGAVLDQIEEARREAEARQRGREEAELA